MGFCSAGIPKGIKFNDVRETLLGIKGVHKVHNLRIWSLSMDRMALSAHLAIGEKEIEKQWELLLKKLLNPFFLSSGFEIQWKSNLTEVISTPQDKIRFF